MVCSAASSQNITPLPEIFFAGDCFRESSNQIFLFTFSPRSVSELCRWCCMPVVTMCNRNGSNASPFPRRSFHLAEKNSNNANGEMGVGILRIFYSNAKSVYTISFCDRFKRFSFSFIRSFYN